MRGIHRNRGARRALIDSPETSSMKFRKTSLALLLALCAALIAPASPASAGTKAPGIDVSRFQGTIDWPTVAASGIRFAFLQAARGNGTDCTVKPDQCGADPFYAINYANAKAAGIRVGPYHRAFATGATRAEARADAVSEAEVFLLTAGTLSAGDLIPVLDVETPFTGLSANRLRTWIRVFVKRVRARLGVKPMIYTNATSWGATGDTREFAKARYPLWVAQWGVSKPSVPAGNWAGRGYSVWQYTSSGTVPGISGRVDLDRLRVGLAKITIH
jgi:GH25 family lysozyme M1 (1,4-beta-N-acetylmuramidase)